MRQVLQLPSDPPVHVDMDRHAPNAAGEEQDTTKAVEPGLWPALKGAASEWSAHKSAKAGAAIAYYSIFSIGQLIVVVISLARGRDRDPAGCVAPPRGRRAGTTARALPPGSVCRCWSQIFPAHHLA